MTISKKDIQKNAFNDLFSVTSETIKPVSNKEAEIVKEDKVEKAEIVKKNDKFVRKNYNLPQDLVEDMSKIVYMNRDIKDNTELLILALRKYLDSKECKDLLKEYDTIKGENING